MGSGGDGGGRQIGEMEIKVSASLPSSAALNLAGTKTSLMASHPPHPDHCSVVAAKDDWWQLWAICKANSISAVNGADNGMAFSI